MVGSAMPDRNTLICTFPILIVLENDRLGGCGCGIEGKDIDMAWTPTFD